MIYVLIAASIVVIVFLIIKGNKGAAKQIHASEAKDLVGNSQAVFLDVRTKDEFREGHIKGAMHIPLNTLQSRISEVKSIGGKKIVVYCYSGGRSGAACQILSKNGITDFVNLTGGISSWTGSGNKIVK